MRARAPPSVHVSTQTMQWIRPRREPGVRGEADGRPVYRYVTTHVENHVEDQSTCKCHALAGLVRARRPRLHTRLPVLFLMYFINKQTIKSGTADVADA